MTDSTVNDYKTGKYKRGTIKDLIADLHKEDKEVTVK